MTTYESIDIFLSYSSRRRAAAHHCARVLEIYGYNVWFDYRLIEGRDFAFQLDDRLRAASVTIVLWCSHSVESRWVHEEADLAESLDRLIPAKMERCEFKLGTRRLQYEDLTGWDGSPNSSQLNGLLEAVARMTGKPPTLDHSKLASFEMEWAASGRKGFAQYEVVPGSQRVESANTKTHVVEQDIGHHSPAPTAPLSRSPPTHSLINPGQLTIGVFPYPPLHCGTEASALDGPWALLARGIARELSLEPNFRFTRLADLLENADLSIDLVVSVFETHRRRQYFDFTRPINRVGLLGLCRNELANVSDDGLRNGQYRVLVQEGEVGWEYIQDEAPRALELKRVVSIDTIDGLEVLDLLRSGRYDLALIDALTCSNFLNDASMSRDIRKAFDTPLHMFDSGVAIRKTSGLDVLRIDRIVSEIRNRPEYLEQEREGLSGFGSVVKRLGIR